MVLEWSKGMILYKGNLILEQQDCDEIKNITSDEKMFEVFVKYILKHDKNINIKRVASIQTPAKEIALSLKLMQCIRENK